MDKKTVYSLPVGDFFGYLSAAREKEKEDFNKQMKAAAFMGWQQYTLIHGMTNQKENPMSFLEYSDTLGILTKQEKDYLKLYKQMETLQQKEQAKKNIEKATNIIQMDRANRKTANQGG